VYGYITFARLLDFFLIEFSPVPVSLSGGNSQKINQGTLMNIDSLLNASSESNQVENVAKLSILDNDELVNYPKYIAALQFALKHEDPDFDKEFYGDIFRESAKDPNWFAISLITNSEREGDGATRLWSLAACCPDAQETELLKRHAIDEARHSLLYLKLIDNTFPNAIDPQFREELKQLSPNYNMSEEAYIVEGTPYAYAPTLDDYIQMNIAEIRTAIHHMLQRKSLEEFCPPENLEHMKSISDALLKDELYHVGYTAKLIEAKADDGLDDLFRKRMRDFNNITKDELAERIFD
jgi:hypothetical protein